MHRLVNRVDLLEPRARPLRSPTRATCLAALVACALVTAGCGGVKFARTSGAHKYRALPVGTDVKVVGAASELPQPTALIGALAWTVESRTDKTADEAAAAERFKKHAARYGCDAVVGLSSKTTSRTSKKTVTKTGADGKRVKTQVEVVTYVHTYGASCVRTQSAPGGLVEGGAAPPPPTATPAAPPATVTPTPPPSSSKPTKAEKDADVAAVWLALGTYKGSFLKNWRDALAKPPESAHDVLAAFGELMVQVTGPTGIWMKTVPNEWFGCVANPKQPQCEKLKEATAEFRPWGSFRRQMERQSPQSARGWLKRNRRRLLGYIERYVPMQPSLSGLQQTKLYMEKMR